jgi:aspartate/methionine/tyrosine aminotransferase
MRPKLFKLEDIFEDYEQETDMNVLGASDAATFTVKELLNFSGEETLLDESLGYHDVKGEYQLRKAVADTYPNGRVKAENVLITQGASEAILLALHALLDPGDRALVCAPAYQALPEMAEAAGAEVIPYAYREHEFEPDLELVRRELRGSAPPKVLVLNTPHNPTGRLLDTDELKELLSLAEAVGTRIVSDEVFSGILINATEPVPSLAELDSQSVVINCLSKVYGLAGLRIGWIVGPEEFITECKRLRYYTTLAPPNLVQRLGGAALRSKSRILERTQRIVTQNYAFALNWLKAHGELFEWNVPQAGMVMLLKLQSLKQQGETERFARDLAESRKVFLVPCRTGFGMSEGYLRLGLGVEPAKFKEGLETLGDYLKKTSRA